MALSKKSRSNTHLDSGETLGLQDPRIDKLVECLNVTGRKLHELKAILYQESLYTGNDADTIRWLMLSSRFSKQVRAVDSIRLSSTTDTEILSNLTSKREQYHYYETELEDFNLKRGKKDLDSLFNNTAFSISESGEKLGLISSNDSATNQLFEMDVNDNKTNLKTTEQTATVGVQTTEFVKSQNTNGTFKESRDTINKYAEKEDFGADVPINIDIFSNSENGASKSGITANTNQREAQKQLKEAPTSHNSNMTKCKVVKLRGREQRRHVQDVFPVRSSSPILKPSVIETEMPSPRFLDRSATERSCLSAGSNDSLSLTNKSKSANESWYEFKERCSSSSLALSVDPSQSKMSTTGTSFLLSDYMPKSPSTSQILKKSVRFSLANRTPPSPRHAHSHRLDFTESSSDDDDVSFDVQQFPCVLPRKQRSRGILRR